jgi:hypothetical protein
MDQKLKVSFDDPDKGWVCLTIEYGVDSAAIIASYTPYDSFLDLTNALLLDFIHFVMTARRAVITKWIKSAFQVKSARKADFVSLPKQEWEYLISCLAAAV